jgi:hypothetical protein
MQFVGARPVAHHLEVSRITVTTPTLVDRLIAKILGPAALRAELASSAHVFREQELKTWTSVVEAGIQAAMRALFLELDSNEPFPSARPAGQRRKYSRLHP